MSERQYVGIDLHRRRSVIVIVDQQGNHLSTARVANNPAEVMAAVGVAGPNPEVVVEATFGWYWLVDLLQESGCRVHLANPSQLNWGNRRVKNDERDALDLVRKLRLGELPEAWIAPPEIRQMRELVRYRAKAVRLRSGLKAQVHAVMGKEGVLPGLGDMFGPGGQKLLDQMQMADSYTTRVESLRDLIEIYNREIVMLDRRIHQQLKDHPGYQAIQSIPGVGKVIAAIMVAEIGDVTRFSGRYALHRSGSVSGSRARVLCPSDLRCRTLPRSALLGMRVRVNEFEACEPPTEERFATVEVGPDARAARGESQAGRRDRRRSLRYELLAGASNLA